jgi:hypothetical protein
MQRSAQPLAQPSSKHHNTAAQRKASQETQSVVEGTDGAPRPRQTPDGSWPRSPKRHPATVSDRPGSQRAATSPSPAGDPESTERTTKLGCRPWESRTPGRELLLCRDRAIARPTSPALLGYHERTRDWSASNTSALATGPPHSPREALCRSVSAGWKHSGSQTGCARSLPVVKRSVWASDRSVVEASDSPRLMSRSATRTRTARLHSPSRSRSRPGRSCCSSRLASLQRRRRSW